MKKSLRGLATGIGSLPYKDADSALDLIFACLPEVPFWPQLPKRNKWEGESIVPEDMVMQFSQNLPLRQPGERGPYDMDKKLEDFYGNIIANNLEHFKITENYASGIYKFRQRLLNSPELLKKIEYIKCQITGPFTFAASVKDDSGVAYLNNPVFMQAFIKGLAMKALWQINFLKEFGKDIIVFVDEPYLAAFGSAYTPLGREDVVKGLRDLTEAIKSQGVLIGVHCCGNTDWSIFTEVEGIDIINFDAFDYLDKFTLYADNLGRFLKRGGVIAWGIVPTQGFSNALKAKALLERIEGGINVMVNKGVDKELLQNNLMLTPACGLGTLDEARSRAIFELLHELSEILRRK